MKRWILFGLLLISLALFRERPWAGADETAPDLTYEDLMGCVTLSMTMDNLLQNIEALRNAYSTSTDALEQADLAYLNSDLTERFNAYVPQYAAECSQASYFREELASICQNPIYGTATFCSVMEW